jgi:tetratricopeptide (TPR) repeat protein
MPGIAISAFALPPQAQSMAQWHYDEAFRLQEAGQLAQADSEHRLFLAIALHYVANARAALGEYSKAVPLFEEALNLTPDDADLNLDYAAAAVDGLDWKTGKALAANTLDLLKSKGLPPNPVAVSVLARAMMCKGEYKQAIEQFKTLTELKPGFESSYSLAGAYLALSDKASAQQILNEMPAKYGDSAALHMKLGRLYGQATFYDDAIAEFKAAIERDPQLRGVHFSLGATYMMRSGEPAFMLAEPELRKEIEIDPYAPLAFTALGRLELVQHRYSEAEGDLRRAVELDPASTAAYGLLGELFAATGRDADAEAAFRRQIALTLVRAKNDFEVQRAYFSLGRLLIKNGNAAEGRKDMDISRDLLYQKSQQMQSRLIGNALQLQVDKTRAASPDEVDQERHLESQLGAMIASSYDNLGVHAAIAGEFATAAGYFRQVAQWNSTVIGIDRKWGRAAFSAGDFASAIPPLSRTLDANPDDEKVRTMLGLSLFNTRDYARTVKVLEPMEAKLEQGSTLQLAYLGSMAIAGDATRGTAQLKALESAHPESPEIHRLLGEAYAARKQYPQAMKELHAALHADPASASAKHALALTTLASGDKSGASKLLAEMVKAGSADADVHYQLGCLLLESGSLTGAIEDLETAVKIAPSNAAYHRRLAEAFQKNEQPQEAEAEGEKSAAAEAENAPASDLPAPQLEELLI